jgi:catechol 2,3-dioxygenase-like lactoylglutathione lyase family enzyme
MTGKKRSKPSGVPKATVFSTAVVVSDRARSVKWYTEKLGLDLVQDMGHWVTVGRKGDGGLLHLCQWSELDRTAVPEKGNLGINLHVPGDFVASCEAFRANGVKFARPPKKEPWGWWARVRDPDGIEITLIPADQ